ncbi:T9SS type A sorting domain-containing protein [Pedobacter sp. SD-b]|uniref:T9SS type A sorting domain-containing protein n=1 Tax=Pedobacter segetis TaxID=2793069 RepID=A0ABS1BLF0_9SPHI|nr:glycosyl hydrolase [Pedobacter segetis]MBK0383571.1 T9SS type A sorting domain-containing protein [Pedobacter segetis]
MKRLLHNYSYRLMVIICLLFLLSETQAQSLKKGIGMITTKTDAKWIQQLPQLNVNWHYRWDLRKDVREPSGIDYVPMVYGRPAPTTADFDYINDNKQQFNYLLGYNEPDNLPGTQGHMSLDSALMFWPQLMASGLTLGSPASINPLSKYMKDFMRKTDSLNYRVDFVTIHTYPGPDATGFLKLLRDVHTAYNKPIWITEFAVADWNAKNGIKNIYTQAQVLGFMKTVLEAMETPEYSFVQRYAWFSNSPPNDKALGKSSLFDYDGGLTPLGQFYANFKEVNTKIPLVNPLIAWNVYGQSDPTQQGVPAQTLNASISSTGFEIGTLANVTMMGTNHNLWGAYGWSKDKEVIDSAINSGKYIKFSVSPKEGKVLSLKKIGDFKIKLAKNGPIYYRLQYRINNGTYKGLTTWFVNRPTATTVFTLENFDLSKIPDLQNIAYGKTIEFRLIPYNANLDNTSDGAVYFGSDANENCFGLEGNIKSFTTNSSSVELAYWNLSGQTNNGANNLAATNIDAALATDAGLVRGAGIVADVVPQNNVWGGTKWHVMQKAVDDASLIDSAIRAKRYLTFSFKVQDNKMVSIAKIKPITIFANNSSPDTILVQYAFDGNNFKNLDTLSYTRPTSGTRVALLLDSINLTGNSEFQDIAPGRIINFRMIPYHAANGTGHFYFGDGTTSGVHALSFVGTVNSIIPPTDVILAAWDTQGANGNNATLAASLVNANVISTGLVRSANVVNTTDANVWGGRQFSTATDTATVKSQNKNISFTITPKADKTVSFTSISPIVIRQNNYAPKKLLIQYAIGNAPFEDLDSMSLSRSGGSFFLQDTLDTIDLSKFPKLQNLSQEKSVTFKLLPYEVRDESPEYQKFLIGDLTSSYDFVVKGIVDEGPLGNQMSATKDMQNFDYQHLNTNASAIYVYPNPVKDVLYISHLASTSEGTIKIVNLNGQLIKLQKTPIGSQLTRLDVSDLQTGFYIVIYQGSKGQQSVKFIKQ